MRVFLDTNIIFSAILFPNSIPDKAFQKALSFPNVAITCDYVLEELQRTFSKKFPNKIDSLNHFLVTLAQNIIIVKVSYETNDISLDIRDDNDKPILRAALEAKADILITGDKDFLESNILNPIIVKASNFYYKY